MMEPLSRALTLDCFELQEDIGHGRFGSVKKAFYKISQTQFAIKIIPKRQIQGSNTYNQLKRQIEIQSRLKHKNICQLFTYFHDQDNVYIILQFCNHGTLASQIHQKKEELSDKKIASIFEQLIHAVAYLHERHVMHRDIKLQNILLDENFNIKLSDFGCCRHYVKSTFKRRTTFCGTMEYICPQMIKEEPYTNSVDVYCIGIILYQLFFFTSPFLGADEDETFKNIKQKEVTFKDEVRVIPEEAKNLIKRLLDKDPRNRPSVRSLFEDKFITMYLYTPENNIKGRKKRFTEDTFTKWKEEVVKSVNNKTQKQMKDHEITEPGNGLDPRNERSPDINCEKDEQMVKVEEKNREEEKEEKEEKEHHNDCEE